MTQTTISREVGMVGGIPVRSLWLLMFYAAELELGEIKNAVNIEDAPEDIPDLVAELLARAVEIRLRRRLAMEFSVREAPLSRVRGKIDVLQTECRQLLSRGRIACRFEELSNDTPGNRFVRAALDAIARLVSPKLLQHRCRALALALKSLGVTGPVPSRSEIESLRFGRRDAEDRMMINAAKLAFDLSIPTEETGNRLLPAPAREERWVRRLFEKAVGGFFRVKLVPQGWRVARGEVLQWPIEWKSDGIDRILPSMKTDVVLEKADEGKRIVIDTKFNAIVTRGWYRNETLRSGYLYQMYAYLRSQEGRGEPSFDRSEGVLLHPAIGETVDESVILQGHRLRFMTVDLAGSGSDFHEQLMRLVQP
jgi:5-methylcytosine-specific restriction enzyme subunit McrC